MEAYLQKREINARVLTFEKHTMTVEDAEKQLGVSREKIIKSLLFVDERGAPIIAIVTGDRRISEEKLKKVYGTQKVKIAPPRTVKSLTGYEAGALPPVGHRKPIRTVIDPKVMAFERIYGGGGAINALLEISPIDVKRLTNADVADVSES